MGPETTQQIDRSSVYPMAATRSPGSLASRLSSALTFSVVLCCLLMACGGSGTTTTTTSQAEGNTLAAITIDPVDSSIAAGTTLQLHATGVHSDGTTEDLSDSVTWASANPTVATVSNTTGAKGLATGGSVGVTTITVTQNGKTGVSAFTVTGATLTSITVEPVNPFVAKGTTVNLAALGSFSDGSVQDLTTQVTWTSGNSSIAQVSSASSGLVTGVNVGSTPIAATLSGIQGATTVTITAATITSLTLGPDPSVARGTSVQLTATANFSDGTAEDLTSQVEWASGNNKVAQVSTAIPTKGLLTGVGVGSASITAILNGIQGSITIAVTPANLISLTITPPDSSIAKGTAVRLTATGDFTDGTNEDLTNQVSWTSGNDGIVQVSDVPATKGLATGLGAGSTSLNVTLHGLHASTAIAVTSATLTSLTITAPEASIANGTTSQLTATGNFSDGTAEDLTSEVSWTSDNDSIAQLSDMPATKGLITGSGVGTTSIAVTLNGIHGSATVSVSSATLIALTITPPDPSIAKGVGVQLRASGIFSDESSQDLTSQVSWSSGNDSIAQVSNEPANKGLVTGLAVGKASIVVTLHGIHNPTTLNVTAATLTSLAITPPDSAIAKGTTEQLTATCDFSDGTTEDCTSLVSWSSGDKTITEISDAATTNGLVTGLNVGTTAVTATLDGVQDSTTVTVSAATLTTLTVDPVSPSIAMGMPQQLAATCDFSDSTTEDCTGEVSWTSGDNMIAQVSDALETKGLVTGLNAGTTSITATLEGIQGSAAVTVTAAILTSLVVTPANPSIASGTSVQMTATGIFSDGTTEDLTQEAEFTSSDPNVAVGDDILSINGLVNAVGPGSATITAHFGGILGSTVVVVTPATLSTITVTANGPLPSPRTTSLPLSATCHLTDGTTEECTKEVQWTTGNPNIAVAYSGGSYAGVVVTRAPGSTSTTATLDGISGSITVTVTDQLIDHVVVTPANPVVLEGSTLQMIATIFFKDGTSEDYTKFVSWTSSNTGVAHVLSKANVTANVEQQSGQLIALQPGATTIIARYLLTSVKSSTLVTVTP
jgi:trimeric autotransporter adhesin